MCNALILLPSKMSVKDWIWANKKICKTSNYYFNTKNFQWARSYYLETQLIIVYLPWPQNIAKPSATFRNNGIYK